MWCVVEGFIFRRVYKTHWSMYNLIELQITGVFPSLFSIIYWGRKGSNVFSVPTICIWIFIIIHESILFYGTFLEGLFFFVGVFVKKDFPKLSWNLSLRGIYLERIFYFFWVLLYLFIRFRILFMRLYLKLYNLEGSRYSRDFVTFGFSTFFAWNSFEVTTRRI